MFNYLKKINFQFHIYIFLFWKKYISVTAKPNYLFILKTLYNKHTEIKKYFSP